MLRKIAAGTSAAVVAAGLAAAPAVASGLPGAGADACGDVAQTEHSTLHLQPAPSFVFGPLADVPHLVSGDRDCFRLASAVADTSAARRRGAGPPPVGNPIPDAPSSPPPDSGPVDSAPPPPAAPPPLEPTVPPAFPPVTAPPPPAPAPPPAPVDRRPSEAVRPPAEAPQRLPQTAADSRPLAVAGGASLVAAGLAWIGGARRRKKRAAA